MMAVQFVKGNFYVLTNILGVLNLVEWILVMASASSSFWEMVKVM